MTEENPAAGGVTPEPQPEPAPAPTPGPAPAPKPEPSPSGGKTDPEPTPTLPPEETVVVGGQYKVNKSAYNEIKHNAAKEAERKAIKTLEEAGRIKSDEDIEALGHYDTLRSDLGKHIDSSGNVDIESYVKGKISTATLSEKKKIESMTKIIDEEKSKTLDTIKQVKLKQTRNVLQSALHGKIVEGSLEDATKLLMHRIRIDDDLDSAEVRTVDDELALTESGEKMTISDLVDEFLADKPHYLPASKQSGGGGQYGSTTNQEYTGPTTLKGLLEGAESKKSLSSRISNVRQVGGQGQRIGNA